MKILIATNNKAKVELYKNIFKNDNYFFVTPKELGVNIDIEENENTINKNAEKKARLYSQKTGLITIADDTSLILENVPKYIQENLFVKRINGKEKTDEELIKYYSNLFNEYGGRIRGKWKKCFSIAYKDHIDSFVYELSEIFVSQPCSSKIDGFPLDSLTIIEKYNKYLAELTDLENEEMDKEQNEKIKCFVQKKVEDIKRKQGIFIACPIGKYIKDDSVGNEYEQFIKSIISICRKYSDNVFIALEREKYGKLRMLGDTCTPDDYAKMKEATYLLAIPEDSMGVSVEIGWASAEKKDIILILDEKYRASEIVKHIHTVTGGEKIVIDTRNNGYSLEKEKIFDFIEKSLMKRF